MDTNSPSAAGAATQERGRPRPRKGRTEKVQPSEKKSEQPQMNADGHRSGRIASDEGVKSPRTKILCLVLDGVYRAVPVFHPVRAPTAEQLQVLLTRIMKRIMRLLTRKGYLIEEQGLTTARAPPRSPVRSCELFRMA